MSELKATMPTNLAEAVAASGGEAADPAEVAASDERLSELLSQVDAGSGSSPAGEALAALAPAPAPLALPRSVMTTAIAEALVGARLTVRCRGVEMPIAVELAPGVSRELVALALKSGDRVVLEQVEGEAPLVVGVLHSRVPEELVLRAGKVRVEADEEVLLRAGTGAVRLRRDGDVEIVGSRISAMSRGLFRIVGRMLRLN